MTNAGGNGGGMGGGGGGGMGGGSHMSGALAQFHSKFALRTRGRRREDNRMRIERSEITIRATLHLSRLYVVCGDVYQIMYMEK